MSIRFLALLPAFILMAVAAPASAFAQSIEYGDNSSEWANDGECDDPRFAGSTMAETLLEEDAYRDAADCEIGMLKGQLRYIGDNTGGIDYGDDSSEWAFDGECDDPRFAGADMADVLLDEDKFRDATDCRQGMESGRLRFVGSSPGGTFAGGINYGDDSSEWAFDGECDDPRFEGAGSADLLLAEDIGRDATDCRAGMENNSLRYVGDTRGATDTGGINYGDDSSEWAFDGECDDPRFEGIGMADILLDEDMYRDASDCREGIENNRLRYIGE